MLVQIYSSPYHNFPLFHRKINLVLKSPITKLGAWYKWYSHLPSEHKALNSNSTTEKKKRKEGRKSSKKKGLA
jgi:hypothetical protein